MGDGKGRWSAAGTVSVTKQQPPRRKRCFAPLSAASSSSKRARAPSPPAVADHSLAALSRTLTGVAGALESHDDELAALRQRASQFQQQAEDAVANTAAKTKDLSKVKKKSKKAEKHFKQELSDAQDEKMELTLFIDKQQTTIDELKAELAELREFKQRARALVLA